jgi:hypothetical protein
VVFFKKFHINPQDIQNEIVPNGILYNFQLQKSGYLSHCNQKKAVLDLRK